MSKIGIIGAMEPEVEELKAKMTVSRVCEKATMHFYEGTLHNAEVVIVKCGIGKVNAAICAQLLVDLFDVSHIINTGVAGSLSADLAIGDIVISSDTIYHDMDFTPLGCEPGQIPGIDVKAFPADPHMVKAAKRSCEKMNPDINVIIDRIVSGDQFVASKDAQTRIIQAVGGRCTEMEGAAIAHVAYLNGIPFVIVRAISDKADDSAHVDYPAFEKAAARHCAALVEDFIQTL